MSISRKQKQFLEQLRQHKNLADNIEMYANKVLQGEMSWNDLWDFMPPDVRAEAEKYSSRVPDEIK